MADGLHQTISAMPSSEVVAIASHSSDRASDFARERGIDRAHASIEELVGDPLVEAIYVASTNERHYFDVLACLGGGKAVLCEKPFALNTSQAAEMVAHARRRGVFLMEAMWMRFQPATIRMLDLVAEGVIGPVLQITADFGATVPSDPGRRWFSATQGGGSLYDLGVYPLALAHLLLGIPTKVIAAVQRAATGVDAQAGILLSYKGGEMAVLSSSMVADGNVEATVSGPNGRIRIHSQFHHSRRVSVHRRGVELANYDVEDLGYQPEVEEVERCLTKGLKTSELWTLDDSLALVDVLQRVREISGLEEDLSSEPSGPGLDRAN